MTDVRRRAGRAHLRWGVAVALSLGLTAGVVAIVVLASHSAQPEAARAPAEPAAERGEPQVAADRDGRWFVHPFGFRFLHPGPSFQRSPELEAKMRIANPDIEPRVFVDAQTGVGLILGGAPVRVFDERDLLAGAAGE